MDDFVAIHSQVGLAQRLDYLSHISIYTPYRYNFTLNLPTMVLLRKSIRGVVMKNPLTPRKPWHLFPSFISTTYPMLLALRRGSVIYKEHCNGDFLRI